MPEPSSPEQNVPPPRERRLPNQEVSGIATELAEQLVEKTENWHRLGADDFSEYYLPAGIKIPHPVPRFDGVPIDYRETSSSEYPTDSDARAAGHMVTNCSVGVVRDRHGSIQDAGVLWSKRYVSHTEEPSEHLTYSGRSHEVLERGVLQLEPGRSGLPGGLGPEVPIDIPGVGEVRRSLKPTISVNTTGEKPLENTKAAVTRAREIIASLPKI